MLARVATLVALLGLLPGLARAESPAEAEARQRYSAAVKLFDQARYAEALPEFERSYALSHYPAILYKIALCHDQLGHLGEAIDTYQRYLAADPKSERREGIEVRIATLRAARAAETPPAKQPPALPARKPAPAPAPTTLALATPAPQPERRPVYKKWWLWTAVGVVAAGAAVGLGLGLTMKSSPTPGSFQPTLGRFGPGIGVR